MDKNNDGTFFYSQKILSNEDEENVDENAATNFPKRVWQVTMEKYNPALKEFPVPDYGTILEPTQKFISFGGNIPVLFPIQTVRPRILHYETLDEDVPIEVEINRRRNQYTKSNVEEIFREHGIENWTLTPFRIAEAVVKKTIDKATMFDSKGMFPLDWHDDASYDKPEDLLNLGLIDGKRYPLPAKALLPNKNILEFRRYESVDITFEDADSNDFRIRDKLDLHSIRNKIYSWQFVAVKDYDNESGKWIVMSLDDGQVYRVPRVLLTFIVEDPKEFVRRVKKALNDRDEAENLIKIQLVIDCMRSNDLPSLSPELYKKINNFCGGNVKSLVENKYVEDLFAEINLNYKRLLLTSALIDQFEKFPDRLPGIKIPKKEVRPMIKPAGVEGPENFNQLMNRFETVFLYYAAEPVNAMYKVVNECLHVESMSLFAYYVSSTSTLTDFLNVQTNSYTATTKHLKTVWVENLALQTCMCLRSMGKGHYDVDVKDWYLHSVSKQYKFLQQVFYRTEDSMRTCMQNSIVSYSTFLRTPCEGVIKVAKNFEWTTDLKTEPFRNTGSAIFYQLLNITPQGVCYSTPLEDFVVTLPQILQNGLMHTSDIPILDPLIMEHLVFPPDKFIPTLSLIEDLFVTHRDLIKYAYNEIIEPAKVYALKYTPFVELFFTVVSDYTKNFAAANKTSLEVKSEIVLQMRLKNDLENNLPDFVTIGPFHVHVEPLKQVLVEKRRDIIEKLLKYFCDRMQKITDDLLNDFKDIYKILTEKPQSIERLVEIEEYISEIPTLLNNLVEKSQVAILEYDILDYFLYNLSDEHFNKKWSVIAWPQKIIVQTSRTKDQQKYDIEIFKKIQLNDLQNFDSNINAHNEEIITFSQQYNPSKVQEMVVELRKIWKNINETKKLGELLKSRQPLFDLPDLDITVVNNIIDGFTPYKNLWSACYDFLKLEEVTTENPLHTVDVHTAKSDLSSFKNVLNASLKEFSDIPEIQEIANTYLKQIGHFELPLMVMSYLKSENWVILHWQELASRAKIDLKYTRNISFGQCLRRGIMDHVDIVKEIGERIIYEADEIKRALEEQERLEKEANVQLLQKRKQRRGRTDI